MSKSLEKSWTNLISSEIQDELNVVLMKLEGDIQVRQKE